MAMIYCKSLNKSCLCDIREVLKIDYFIRKFSISEIMISEKMLLDTKFAGVRKNFSKKRSNF